MVTVDSNCELTDEQVPVLYQYPVVCHFEGATPQTILFHCAKVSILFR